MLSFKIIPSLGLRDDINPDDEMMFSPISEGVARAYTPDAEWMTFGKSLSGRVGAATKAGGRTIFCSTDIAAVTSGDVLEVLGMQSPDSLYRAPETLLVVRDEATQNTAQFLRIETSGPTATLLSTGIGSTTFAMFEKDSENCYMVNVGEHILIGDGYTPTANRLMKASYRGILYPAVLSGSAAPFVGPMEYFKNRLLVAHDEEVIWYSNLNFVLPTTTTSTTLEFNTSWNIVLPKKSRITGLKALNSERLFCFCRDVIYEIVYQANYLAPFNVRVIKDGVGTMQHHTIVHANGLLYAYDTALGFYSFDGYNIKVISSKIDTLVATIDPIMKSYGSYVTYFMPGSHSEKTNEVVWAISTDGSYNTYLLYYNYATDQWRKSPIKAKAICEGHISVNSPRKSLFTINELTAGASSDIYYDGQGQADAGGIYNAYRTEPVLAFGGLNRSLLLEVWFNIENSAASQFIDVYYRGADTVAELNAASFSFVAAVSSQDPENAVCYMNSSNRYHQIKWGMDNSSDLVSVREIEFRYVHQGRY